MIYSNTIYSPFVFNDKQVIVQNKHIRWEGNQGEELRALTDISNPIDPVTSFSFALNYYFDGLNPAGYHLTNIIIHLICGVLVYLLMSISFKLINLTNYWRFQAALCALFFVSHPINTTAVTYLSNRATPVSTLFFLACLLLYLLSRTAPSNFPTTKLIASLLAGLLAVSTNPGCISVLFIILAYEYLIFDHTTPVKPLTPNQLNPGAFLSLVIIGLFIIFYGNNSNLGVVITTNSRAFIHLLSLVLFPFVFRFNFQPRFPHSSSLFEPFSSFISFIFIGCLLYLIFYCVKTSLTLNRKTSDEDDSSLPNNKKEKDFITSDAAMYKLLSLGLIWFFSITWIDFLTSPKISISENRLYLPAVWLYAIAIYLIDRYFISQDQAKSYARRISLGISLVLLLSWGTYARNQDWQSEEAMLQATFEYSAREEKAYYRLALERLEEKDYKKAKGYLKKAILVKGNFPEAILKLAGIFMEEEDWEEAEKYYRLALHFQNEKLPEASSGLGIIYREIKKMPSEAYTHFSNALKENPDFGPAYLQRAKLFFYNWGNREKAIENLNQCLRIEPGNKEAVNLLKKLTKTTNFHNGPHVTP